MIKWTLDSTLENGWADLGGAKSIAVSQCALGPLSSPALLELKAPTPEKPLRLRVNIELDVEPDLLDAFDQIAHSACPSGTYIPAGEENVAYGSETGVYVGTHWIADRHLPASFVQFLNDVESTLHSHVGRYTGLFRWRYGLSSTPLQPASNTKISWSINDGDSHSLVRQPPLQCELRDMIVAKPTRVDLQQVIDTETSEPLDNQLLLEAEALLVDNPRAALILAVTALEVGLSSTIAQLVPDAKWLVDSHLPPVVSILRDYLSQLPAELTVDGQRSRPSRELVNTIRIAVESRNRVVHAGERVDDLDVVTGAINAVRQVLRILDFYRGNEWARNFIFRSSVRAVSSS